jgi:hypothetical protein
MGPNTRTRISERTADPESTPDPRCVWVKENMSVQRDARVAVPSVACSTKPPGYVHGWPAAVRSDARPNKVQANLRWVTTSGEMRGDARESLLLRRSPFAYLRIFFQNREDGPSKLLETLSGHHHCNLFSAGRGKSNDRSLCRIVLASLKQRELYTIIPLFLCRANDTLASAAAGLPQLPLLG